MNNSEQVGNWWNDNSIQLWRIDGHIYALYGWNGECFSKSWEVAEDLRTVIGDAEYSIWPVYRYEAEGKPFPSEDAPDFDEQIEYVGYKL